MKIAIIDESIDRIGGVERVISTLANKLSETNDIEVFSEYKISDKPFYEYNKRIKINYLVNAMKQKTNKLNNKGIKYYYYRIFEKILINSKLKYNIKKNIDNLKEADVIIFGRVFTALDFLPIIEKNNINSKIIVRDAIHLEYYDKKIKEKIIRYFPKLVNTFIVSSEESIKFYKNNLKNSNINFVKIYNPIGIKPITKYDITSKTVISIGRLDEQKGFENLIDAFQYVHLKYEDWKLIIYGSGNYEKKLREKIEQNKANEYIKILPAIKDVVQVFNKSSIFVLPSRYEGYANVLVEAMTCGLPCISYNWLMGVEEIIKDKQNGIIVQLKDRKRYFDGYQLEEDINNLAESINFLIDNEDYRKKIGKEAEKIIETRKIENIIDEWIKIIN